MSDIVMGAPWEAQSPARWEKPNLPVVDLRSRLPWISQQSKVTPNYVHLEPRGDLQELERAGIREILCEMLASSLWEGRDGSGREEGEGIRKDPDERVQDVIVLFFRSFERLGTAASVARYFAAQRQPFPRRDGWGSLEVSVTWGALSVSRTVNALKSPVYAGIYCYDRNRTWEEDPEDPCTGGRILIPGSHPGYITVEPYERNGTRLVANRNMYGGARHRGSAREGKSLLQGIVLCGKCGRPMNVTYRSDRSWIYTCRQSAIRRICQEVHSRHVDPLVEAMVLETVSREELHLAVGALEQLEKEYEQVRQSLPFELTEEQRRNVLALAEDLPRLWKAPTTRNSQRKRLLRLLIEDITLRNVDDPWSTEVAIRWKTGVVSRHRAERVQPHPQTTSPEAVARIQELYVKMTDQELADALNAEGHRSGYGKEFTVQSVSSIRQTRGMIKPRGWRKPSWNPNEPPKEDDHGHN